MRASKFRVMVATDGSREARVALAVAMIFPWPKNASADGVVARGGEIAGAEWPANVQTVLDRRSGRIAASAQRRLQRRWPATRVRLVDKPPVAGILSVAPRGAAGALVIGTRGRGALGRLFLGSVSRGVVRRARCPMLVVARGAREIKRFVVGIDGSPNGRRAVEFLARLPAPSRAHVTVVRVVEPLRPPSMALVPRGVSGALAREVARFNADQRRRALATVEAAARRLRRGGWTARTALAIAAPVDGLLSVARKTRADCVVVGARGASGVHRLILGSVVKGLLNRSRTPVLIVP